MMSSIKRSWLRSIPSTRTSFLLLIFLLSSTGVSPQSISNTPVPPLQWINLTGLLSGSNAAPPLKDASIGYDENSRNLVIFGGESSQGFPQADTYLLNLDTLTWRSPSTLPQLSGIRPPVRSAAISGQDMSANYRHAHIVIGGKGEGGSALQDIWEFDYDHEFWSQVTVHGPIPPGRWGAAGGADPRAPSIPDVNFSWPNNTIFMAGGFNGNSPLPLSDVWQFNVTGVLSSNNVDQVLGTWEQVRVSGDGLTTAKLAGLGGAVVWQGTQNHIAAIGGCNATTTTNASCAVGDSFVLNVDTESATSPPACPAPRVGGAVALNMNTASGAFNSQVFLLLGIFNASLWDDGGGLNQGEVAVLDVNTGAWARVLPAGDPGTNGKQAFPSPREGAAVFSTQTALVGNSRSSSSDIVVFGGRDEHGNYLSELWILRAYNDVIQSSGAHWSGFGDGKLTTGTNATGAGVTVKYMTQCASAISPSSSSLSTSTSSSSSGRGSPTSTTSGGQPDATQSQGPASPTVTNQYDTSTTHKALAPVSVALVFPALVLYRLSQPYVSTTNQTDHRIGYFYLACVVALAAFALGIAGLATAFTSLTYGASSVVKRSFPQDLATAHGRAGLALWIGLYGVVPLLIAITIVVDKHKAKDSLLPSRLRRSSNELAEKLGLYHHRGASPVSPATEMQSPPASPRRFHSRVRSWGSATLNRFSLGHARHSSESAVDGASSPSTHSFEVVNRSRARHVSANSLAAFSDPRPSLSPHNLSDMSWMRRSPGPSGDHRPEPPPTPGTAILDMMSTKGLVNSSPIGTPVMPTPLKILAHCLLHAFLIGLCALSLAALWSRAPVATFAVFLAWTVCFYILIVVLAWFGMPRESVLSVALFRLRASPAHTVNGTSTPHAASSLALEGMAPSIPFPVDGSGPYQHHQPLYRTAHDSEYPTSLSHAGQTVEDDYDDGEDEETRQQRMEDEMNRRDVSIVTVPKRRLVVKNPELS